MTAAELVVDHGGMSKGQLVRHHGLGLGLGLRAHDVEVHAAVGRLEAVVHPDPVELLQLRHVVDHAALGDDKWLEPQVGGNGDRLRAAPCDVEVVDQRLRVSGAGPDREVGALRPHLHVGHLEDVALEGEALVADQALDDVDRLFEELPGLVHVGADATVLAASGAPAEPADELPVVAHHVLQHHDLLGHPDRVVPGQHDDHRAQVDLLRAGRPVRQPLKWVTDHRVRAEVVLDGPDGVEAERLDQIAEPQLLLPDLIVDPVAYRLALAGLERREPIDIGPIVGEQADSDLHDQPPPFNRVQ